MNKLLEFVNEKTIAIFFSLVALYLRFQRLALRDFWSDELYQFNQMSGGLKKFWLPRYNYGDHTGFPGDYVLCKPFVEIFGMNKWGLAIPHILATIIGLYFLYAICRKYFKTRIGFFVAFFIVCFNNELIFHSFEFRPYAVLPTLALGCLYFSLKVVEEWDALSSSKKFWIGAFFIFSVFYHAYGFLIFLATCSYALISRREVSYKDFFKSKTFRYFLILIFVSSGIWLWYASVNNFGLSPDHHKKMHTIMTPQGRHLTFEYIPNPIVNPLGFLKSIFGNLVGYFKLSYIFLLGLILPFVLSYKERFKQIGFLLCIIVIPLMLIILVDTINSMWFLQRQFGWMMPLFALLLAWCWESGYKFVRNK